MGSQKALYIKWKNLNFILKSCGKLLKGFKQGNGMIKKIGIIPVWRMDWKEAIPGTGNAVRGLLKDLEVFKEFKLG